MSDNVSWPIGEFVSLRLSEDKINNEFTIILKGDLKYSDLIGIKIGKILITQEDIDEYVPI